MAVSLGCQAASSRERKRRREKEKSFVAGDQRSVVVAGDPEISTIVAGDQRSVVAGGGKRLNGSGRE